MCCVRCWQDRKRRRGGAASEFAILSSILAFVLLIAIDFCRLFYHYNVITNCARNGAMCAAALAAGSPMQSPYTNVQTAALADAGDLNPPLTADNVTQSYQSDGAGNSTVSVTVQYQFNLVTSYLGFGSVNLSRQVTMLVPD
jgi:Flp pilus assembly protein TadG